MQNRIASSDADRRTWSTLSSNRPRDLLWPVMPPRLTLAMVTVGMVPVEAGGGGVGRGGGDMSTGEGGALRRHKRSALALADGAKDSSHESH
jgi:hypothetical protein